MVLVLQRKWWWFTTQVMGHSVVLLASSRKCISNQMFQWSCCRWPSLFFHGWKNLLKIRAFWCTISDMDKMMALHLILVLWYDVLIFSELIYRYQTKKEYNIRSIYRIFTQLQKNESQLSWFTTAAMAWIRQLRSLAKQIFLDYSYSSITKARSWCFRPKWVSSAIFSRKQPCLRLRLRRQHKGDTKT